MSKRTLTVILVLLVIIAAVIWVARDKKTNEQTAVEPILSVSALNQTRSKPATAVPAQPQDIVVFTLSAENPSPQVIQGYVMEANISGISDKATLIDAQGASYNSGTSSLVWTPLDIPAQSLIQKQFSVRVNPIPVGSANPVMSIKFNNELNIALASPHVSGASTSNNAKDNNYKAPVTGLAENLLFWLAGLATFMFAIVRIRQKKTV